MLQLKSQERQGCTGRKEGGNEEEGERKGEGETETQQEYLPGPVLGDSASTGRPATELCPLSDGKALLTSEMHSWFFSPGDV